MQEIIKKSFRVSNEINKSGVSNLTLNEQKLLFFILNKIYNLKDRKVKIELSEIQNFIDSNLSKKESFCLFEKMLDSLLKCNFNFCYQNSMNVKYTTKINIFSKINFIEFNNIFKSVELVLNDDFKSLIFLNSKYMLLSFFEISCLNSRYSQNLYRLLKQWRGVGFIEYDFKEFKTLMGIPSSYKYDSIKRQILDNSCFELSTRAFLFDSVERVIFKNLTYKPVFQKNKVAQIQFSFEPQQSEY